MGNTLTLAVGELLLLFCLVLPARALVFQFPLETSDNLTQDFGAPNSDHPCDTKASKLHGGQDYLRPPGTPVRAAADGVVRYARKYGECVGCYPGDDPKRGGFGYVVLIEHDLGLGDPAGPIATTVYAHLDHIESTVVEGQTIARGALLGGVGSYPCWNAHLHFAAFTGSMPLVPGSCDSFPSGLAGYLCPTKFPGGYVDATRFVLDRQGASTAGGCVTTSLNFGEAKMGELTATPSDCDFSQAPNRKADKYVIKLKAGEFLSIRVGATDFLPWVVLHSPVGIFESDQGSSNIAAYYDRLIPPSLAGTWTIEIGAQQQGGLGAYSLEAKGPTAQCSCQVSPSTPAPIDFGTTAIGNISTRTFTVTAKPALSACWEVLHGFVQAGPTRPFFVDPTGYGTNTPPLDLVNNGGAQSFEVDFQALSGVQLPGVYPGTFSANCTDRVPVTVPLTGLAQ